MTSPATLDRCSGGTLVGGGPRYPPQSLARSGSLSLFRLHHVTTLSIRPITGSDRYCVNCFHGTSSLLTVDICRLNHVAHALPRYRLYYLITVFQIWQKFQIRPKFWPEPDISRITKKPDFWPGSNSATALEPIPILCHVASTYFCSLLNWISFQE